MSSLLSVQWGFSQPGEKLAFNPQTTSPLGIQASPHPTRVPWVVPPHQPHAARVARLSSVSTAELKKPHLAKAAEVTRWHAAWPRICFTCETAHHLNLAVNNLARMLEKKKKRGQLTTSPLPEIKYFTSPSHSCSENGRWRSPSLSESWAGGSTATADSARGIDGRLSRPYWGLSEVRTAAFGLGVAQDPACEMGLTQGLASMRVCVSRPLAWGKARLVLAQGVSAVRKQDGSEP